MAYIYTLEMKLAKASKKIDLRDFYAQIEETAAAYNETGADAFNQKSIELLDVKDNAIQMRLRSAIKLNAVGKALRYYSQGLIMRVPALADNLTGSGQLFRVSVIGIPSEETDSTDLEIPLKIREIDDAELVKALVDYVCRKRDPNTATYLKKVKAVEKMKQLAVEAGILEC